MNLSYQYVQLLSLTCMVQNPITFLDPFKKKKRVQYKLTGGSVKDGVASSNQGLNIVYWFTERRPKSCGKSLEVWWQRVLYWLVGPLYGCCHKVLLTILSLFLFFFLYLLFCFRLLKYPNRPRYLLSIEFPRKPNAHHKNNDQIKKKRTRRITNKENWPKFYAV